MSINVQTTAVYNGKVPLNNMNIGSGYGDSSTGVIMSNMGGNYLILKFQPNTLTLDDGAKNFIVNSSTITLGNGTSSNQLIVNSQNTVLGSGDNSHITMGTGVNDFLTVNSNKVYLSTVNSGIVGIANNGSNNVINVGTTGQGNNMTMGTGVNDFHTVNSNRVYLSTVNSGIVGIANNGSNNAINIGTTGQGNNMTVGTGVNDFLTVNSNTVYLSTVNNGVVGIANNGSNNVINVGTTGQGNNMTIGTGVNDFLHIMSNNVAINPQINGNTTIGSSGRTTNDVLNINTNTIVLGKSTGGGQIIYNYPTTNNASSTFGADVTIQGNLTINHNLTINGTITSTNTVVETIIVNDAYLNLATNGTDGAANVNVGLYTNMFNSSTSLTSVSMNTANTVTSGFIRQYQSGGTTLGSSFWYLFDSNYTTAGGIPDVSAAHSTGAQLQVGAVYATSDERLKTDISIIENALDNIDKLNGVYYKWKDGHNGDKREIGVIAQDIQRQFPELIHVNDDGFLTVDYPRLTGVLIEGVKELRKENNEIRSLIAGIYEKLEPKEEEPKEEKKKVTRKKKSVEEKSEESNFSEESVEANNDTVPKKRGRKPKSQ